MKKLIFLLAFVSTLASCNVSELKERPGLISSKVKSVSAEFVQPQYGGALDGSISAQTKALDWNTGSLHFDPRDIKRIGVVPEEGFSELMMYSVTPSAEGNTTAKFQVRNFTLKDGQYCAVFPATVSTYSENTLEFSLAGQRQVENTGTAHLSAYDYNVASCNVTPEGGNFSFDTQIAWIRICAQIKSLDCFKSLQVDAKGGVPQTGGLNTSTGKITFSGSGILNLDLGPEDDTGIYLAKGQDLIAYVTVPAQAYDNLTLRMFSDNGLEYSYTVDKEITLEAGKYYTANLSCLSCQINYSGATKVQPNDNADFGEGVTLVSNDFANGKGTMEFSGPVTKIGWHSFNNCENLTGIVLPEGVTELEKEAFFDCDKLSFISLPDNIVKIGESCFAQCDSLKEITIPQGIEEISGSCFISSGLTRIELPEGVKIIRSAAFEHCVKLSEIILPASLESIETTAFFAWDDRVCPTRTLTMKGQTPPDLVADALRGCCVTHLHIPAGTRNAYKSFIEALPDNVVIVEDE